MVAYRFLRPDDLPLIVHAYNTCYRIHHPQLPEMDLEGMKKQVLERNIWSSSCMVAKENGEAVGILIGAKRDWTRIVYLGVKPNHQRRGIATHMLRSLSSKLAILGPPGLVAELPDDHHVARGLFEQLGYSHTESVFDWKLQAVLPPVKRSPAVIGIPIEDALKLLPDKAVHAWDRSMNALVNLKEKLECLALLSPDAIMACLIYCRNEQGGIKVKSIYGHKTLKNTMFLEVLFRTLNQQENGSIRIDKIHQDECSFDVLTKIGFQSTKKWDIFKCQAHSFESIA